MVDQAVDVCHDRGMGGQSAVLVERRHIDLQRVSSALCRVF
ncbi:putative leader peptide [Prauserella flavalba]